MQTNAQVPKCRKCGAGADVVPTFIEKAKVHNESGSALKVKPSTFAFGPGVHYDPSTQTFICPACQEEKR
jgi:DNA-directed RNA polymerase subunit M/transcription elongation factor TFIIS